MRKNTLLLGRSISLALVKTSLTETISLHPAMKPKLSPGLVVMAYFYHDSSSKTGDL